MVHPGPGSVASPDPRPPPRRQVERLRPSRRRTSSPGGTRPADVSRPDRAALMNRAESLLAQLAEIEERLAVAQKDSGLSGKAKVSDLTAKRDSVLRTLAALEKAKRALEPA